MNYYRLKYTTSNGDIKYSPIKSVLMDLDSLISFTSNIEDGNIILNWSIDKELYTNAYTIEIEETGGYRKIGLIDANIKLEELISGYSWNTNISLSGVYSFRLSQLIDNKIVDTKLLKLEIIPTSIKDAEITNDFILKSNLLNSSTANLEFKILEKLSGSNISIVDILGRTVIEIGAVTEVGSWKSVPILNFPPATYRVVIKTTNGSIYSVPFVVVH